ncbi:MAG TPA: POTRA domain-containing protein [Blastocatellia bacterium]
MKIIFPFVLFTAFGLQIVQSVALSAVPSQKERASVLSQDESSQDPDSDEDKPKDIRCGDLLVRGSDQLTQAEVCRMLEGVSGGPFDSDARFQIESALIKEYNARGFLDAAVVWEAPENVPGHSRAAAALLIEEGKVYTVRGMEMLGNKTTRDNIIRRRVALQEGGWFEEDLVALSIRRLNQLGVFEEITRDDVIVQADTKEHFVDIRFMLKEK